MKMVSTNFLYALIFYIFICLNIKNIYYINIKFLDHNISYYTLLKFNHSKIIKDVIFIPLVKRLVWKLDLASLIIGKIATRRLEVGNQFRIWFLTYFSPKSWRIYKKNTMNESVHLTLYVLSSRKQQGASFLVGTQLQQWKNKRERKKIGFPLLSFFSELLEFFWVLKEE